MMPAEAQFPDRAMLESHQRARLQSLLGEILPRNDFYARKFGRCHVAPESGGIHVSKLPFTTKSELVADQAEHPPYGTGLTYPRARFTRLHQTSGTSTGRPLRWLDTPESWEWMLACWRQKFAMMRITPADRFCFAFSFGPFIGFWTGHEAALRTGSFALTLGGFSSAARLRAIIDHEITVVGCTPTYALHLAEVARAEKLDLARSAVRIVIVAGEPGGSIPATRAAIESAWGARVIDHCGMTETGPMGVECIDNPGGIHILESDFIAEVIDPEAAQPISSGTPGELVVTNLGRLGTPLIRYRTGDIVCVDTRPCPCGSPFMRLDGGILGRTDTMIYVRGNNLYPSAIEAVLRGIRGLSEYRVEVDRREALAELCIAVEPSAGTDGTLLAQDVGRAIRDQLLLRAVVTVVPPGSLPRFEMKAKRVVQKT
jgi:phenylacetate-CoA ligase